MSGAAPIEPGAVRLTVADLDRQRDFYERTIGLGVLEGSAELARLGADSGPLVELVAAADAPPRPRGTTGLFHLAILLPDRADLARALLRVGGAGWRFTGASDHLVSEALYLDDPEGNGIEIYRDRLRGEWRYVDGELQMATIPLDLEGVLAELAEPEPDPGPMPAGTRIGHVHLQVANLDEARAFYVEALGFEITVDSYMGALFVSTGGYHHHIGLNVWAGEGAPPPPPGALGLRRFELAVDGDSRLDEIEQRLCGAGYEAERGDNGIRSVDPSGNAVLLRGPG